MANTARPKVPHSLDQLKGKKLGKRFEEWLEDQGVEVQTPTSEWEVMRFKTGTKTSVIYTNKAHRLNYTGEALEAMLAFLNMGGWKPVIKNPRRKAYSRYVPGLLERDGPNCFYCLKPLGEDVTVEHIISRSRAGPNRKENFVLTHSECNRDAGNLSAAEKFAIRERALEDKWRKEFCNS